MTNSKDLKQGKEDLNILKNILKIMGLKDYLDNPTRYKNLREFIILCAGICLLILAFMYIFFISEEPLNIKDFIILLGYIFAFIAGKRYHKNGE